VILSGQGRWEQPLCGLSTRVVDAGLRSSSLAGRTGRRTNSPPQFGQRASGSRSAAQLVQKVHSKEQIKASVASGGRSLSQHSQFGLSSSAISPAQPLTSPCCAMATSTASNGDPIKPGYDQRIAGP
jgi:hypothetical protein